MFAVRLISKVTEKLDSYLRSGPGGGLTLSGPGLQDDGEDGLQYWAKCALFETLQDAVNAITRAFGPVSNYSEWIKRAEIVSVTERLVMYYDLRPL